MAATDNSGAGRGWTGWLARQVGATLGAPAADRAAAPATRPAGDLVRAPPEILLLDAVISGMPEIGRAHV